MNVPKLRFGEFNKEWSCKNLGDIAQFSKGKGIAKADISKDGQFECIRYGELYTQYKETIKQIISRTNLSANELVLSEANDVIIPASGETQLDIATASCVLKKGVALGGDLNIIRSDANGVFLSYYLNNTKKQSIANLAQGISVVHLYASQLKTLELNIPNSDEQQKIADFLSAVDDKITALTAQKTALTQYKQGMMQRIFSQTLRFKDDDGADYPDWGAHSLADEGKVFSGGTPLTSNKAFYMGNIPFIKSGEINADKTEQFISDMGLTNSSAKIVEKGDLLYALYGATSGEVGISKISGAINQAVLCIRSNYDNTYLCNYLRMCKERILSTYLQGGQGNLSAEIVKSLVVPTPCINEQTKIAQFLTKLDDKINAVDSQIQSAQQWKQGLLQQIFV